MELSDRKKHILKTVVDAYIASGEPVSSKYLTDKLDFGLSSATIRNEMSDLESMGYLEHLHTSSGRVPTNLGYREYVGNLMERYKLTLDEILLMNSLLKEKLNEFNDVFSETTHLLSKLTNYTAVSVSKKPKRGFIKKFECVFVDPLSFLLVMITSDNSVKTRHVHTDVELNGEVVLSINRILNDCLSNMEISSLSFEKIMFMEQKLGGYRDIVGPILRVVYEVVSQLNEYELNVDGVSNLLEYPEFADAVRARELVRLVEEKQELIEKMTYDPQKKLNVYIGTEDGRLDGASFIVRPFSLESGVTGAVGLIGPKRMNYSRAIAKLDYITARIISDDGEDSGEERINDERKEDI